MSHMNAPHITISDIMNPLVSTARILIADQTGLSRKSIRTDVINRVEKLVLKEVTSFINLKGILNGKFVVSMDEGLIRAIVRNFVIGGLKEDEVAQYVEDTIAECSNIILGNSIKMFPDIDKLLTVDAPLTMSCEYAAVRYSDAGIWASSIESSYGNAIISFISADVAA